MDILPAGRADADASPGRLPAAARRLRLTLSVMGLKRGDDEALKAEWALEQIPGVIHAYVNPATEMAYIEYDPELTGEHDLAEAIDSAGFRALIAATDGVVDAD